MKKLLWIVCVVVVVSPAQNSALEGQLRAQSLPPTSAAVPAQGLNQNIAARSRELNSLFNDIWQDKLKHAPEYATSLGDYPTTTNDNDGNDDDKPGVLLYCNTEQVCRVLNFHRET